MAKEQKHRKNSQRLGLFNWEREQERNEKCREEKSIILLVQEQGDSQWQQQTDLMKENTSLLRKISCITSLQNSFTRAGKVLRRTGKNSQEYCMYLIGIIHKSEGKKLYLKKWGYKPLFFREWDWLGSTGNWKVIMQPLILSLKLASTYDIKLGQMNL